MPPLLRYASNNSGLNFPLEDNSNSRVADYITM